MIDPHLLVAQEDIVQENHDDVSDTVPQDQPRIIERPTTVFVEQKGIYCIIDFIIRILILFMYMYVYDFLGKQGFSAYKRDDLIAVAGPLVTHKDSVLPSTFITTSQLCVVCTYIFYTNMHV